MLKADVARLTPLPHDHIHMLGKDDFMLSPEVAQGQLGSLRNPSLLEGYLGWTP